MNRKMKSRPIGLGTSSELDEQIPVVQSLAQHEAALTVGGGDQITPGKHMFPMDYAEDAAAIAVIHGAPTELTGLERSLAISYATVTYRLEQLIKENEIVGEF